MPVDPASREQLDELGVLIRSWAERAQRDNDLVLAVDQLPRDRRWFIRLAGEEKQVTTIWFHLRERTLHFETQFMPSPEENREQLFEYLLRLNDKLFGVRFSIGDEEALYLMGQLPWSAVDEDELDRIVGSAYAYTEQYFRPAMRIGYQSKFRG
ncbi:MAG TPA: YbjN domain-containing protein [Acidimicrobiales bacterium]|nr:YbjN domain-containing protein [Acidimicrobiales bacterium]